MGGGGDLVLCACRQGLTFVGRKGMEEEKKNKKDNMGGKMEKRHKGGYPPTTDASHYKKNHIFQRTYWVQIVALKIHIFTWPFILKA